MATHTKIINRFTDLGIHKMQEHLDPYIALVNKGEKSFSETLEELIDIELGKCTFLFSTFCSFLY